LTCGEERNQIPPAKCFSSLATSPNAAATPAQEVEEDIKAD